MSPELIKTNLIQVIRVAILKHFCGMDVKFKGIIEDLGVFEVEIQGVKFDIHIREVKK